MTDSCPAASPANIGLRRAVEQKENFPSSRVVAGEPASIAGLPALSPAGEAGEAAYWRGYHAALAAAAQPAADESESPRVRRMRIDGFSGEKQAVFLEGIAAGLTVIEAAKAARISVTTVYNFRNRRAGRAFNIAWEAAYKDDERLVTAVAEEFEELLDCIEEGGDAEAFIEARRPPSVQYDPGGRSGESEADFIARYKRFHRFDGVDPAGIDVADLDPDRMDDWTDR
jgi:hypothetical protein